ARKGLSSTRYDTTFFKDLIVGGLKDSRPVLRWIMFGIVLAVALKSFVPADIFSSYFGPSLLGLGATIVAATIIEVCSEGSTPIAADLLTRANAPGNSFAFLMTGASTDYTEIMVMKESTASWKAALFLPLLTVPQIVLVALVMNAGG
ncbi:permease, partial [Spongiibacter marinus]|uniref:permease n=1 Tax=Spongiibacter marinus TaxID=354246 RepID=UPI003C3C94AE